MGMDLSYQAIPDDSPALERARRDGLFGCELEFWSNRAKPDTQYDAMLRRVQNSSRPHDIAFVDSVAMGREAASGHPGLGSRHWAWSRGYDAIYYLLSLDRRNESPYSRALPDWTTRAIYGAQVLHEAAVTTIGSQIRYNPPELVREHAELLQIVTRDDLSKHFDPERMQRSGVYKYLGDPDGFENWMWPEFEAWRDFLQLMLQFPDEGLLCCVG